MRGKRLLEAVTLKTLLCTKMILSEQDSDVGSDLEGE